MIRNNKILSKSNINDTRSFAQGLKNIDLFPNIYQEWQEYTPANDNASAFTTFLGSARYKYLNKNTVLLNTNWTFGVNSTQSFFRVSLPVDIVNPITFAVMAVRPGIQILSGYAYTVFSNNVSLLEIGLIGNTFTSGNNYRININGAYEVKDLI